MKSTEEADKKLKALGEKFLEEYLAMNPTRATEAGEHKHDARWPDPSEEGDRAEKAFCERWLKELSALPKEGLGEQAAIDKAIIEDKVRYIIFAIDELREAETNPLMYTGMVGDGLDPLVTRDYAPIEERLKNLQSRLEGVPKLVEIAKKRLGKPAKIHTEIAIRQNEGLIGLVEKDLPEHFGKAPSLKAGLEKAAKGAAAALKDLQTFLQKDLLSRSDGSFRIGKVRFTKKLGFELADDVDIDEVAKGARALLEKTQGDMFETSRELWPTLMKGEKIPEAKTPEERKAVIKKVLDKLAEDRPDNATIVKEAKRLLGETTTFVKEKDLVRLPTEPCDVIEMPEYRRGVAIAYCDASGPLEKKQETFYAIAPTPKDWPKPRQESFYKEYNRSMLADLTIHEAMPGHFLQIAHSNKHPSTLRAVPPSSYFMALTRAASFLTKASYTPSCTYRRLAHTQVWPALRYLLASAPSTALSRSASSNTMKGALPPSSSASFLTVGAHCAIRMRPTSVEPVNDRWRTMSLAHSSRPMAGASSPVTTLMTPAGMPARWASSAAASAVSGVNSAGLMTTVQPAASAGATLRVIMASGKFHGVMAAHTPIGCWITVRRLLRSNGVRVSPCTRLASSANHSTKLAP